jgi:hypothetical protein
MTSKERTEASPDEIHSGILVNSVLLFGSENTISIVEMTKKPINDAIKNRRSKMSVDRTFSNLLLLISHCS